MSDAHRDAWAAGFMDGDGCVRLASLRAHGYRVRELQAQADQVGAEIPAALARLAAEYGGAITVQAQAKRREGLRPHWRWRITGKAAAAFLAAIEPYSVVKREQILLALEAREVARGKDSIEAADWYEARIRALKRDTSPEDEFASMRAHIAEAEIEHGERWAAQRENERVAALARYHQRKA